MKSFLIFVMVVVISFLPGIFGVFFTPHGGNDLWYNELAKSFLTPDAWVFSVAWSLLYLLLGIALYLIIRHSHSRQSKAPAYALFAIQMGLNALWTYLFFGLHFMGAALLCLVALIGISIWMARVFQSFNKYASYLVWPYVAWLCFAFWLNGVMVYLN